MTHLFFHGDDRTPRRLSDVPEIAIEQVMQELDAEGAAPCASLHPRRDKHGHTTGTILRLLPTHTRDVKRTMALKWLLEQDELLDEDGE